MAISFIGGSMVILIVNHSAIPGAFAEIFSCAFSKESALGGAAGGADFHGVRDGSCGADRGIRKGQRHGKDRHGPHQS